MIYNIYIIEIKICHTPIRIKKIKIKHQYMAGFTLVIKYGSQRYFDNNMVTNI